MAIKLADIAIYHPSAKVTNDFFIQHFSEKGRDISSFLRLMGRNSRYVIDNDSENTLTMGVEAALRVMKSAELSGDDIDLLIFSTQVPEFNFPSNAVYARDLLGIKGQCLHFDMNANCAGMTVAVDMASRYLQSNKRMQRALIIGSDYNTLLANPDQEITYANYGDAAVAVILERSEGEGGFIDSLSFGDAMHKDKIRYPKDGLAAATRKGQEYGHIDWIQFDASESLGTFLTLMEDLLNKNNLGIDDVDCFCLSQFAYGNIEKTQEHFNIPDEKIAYVGDDYGYTGTSSPFLALYHAIERGQAKPGDTILFVTIGAGYQHVAVLFTI